MYEIKRIPFKINEHNPKAQSVCLPDKQVNLNEFYYNLQQQQIKIYESKRGTKNC